MTAYVSARVTKGLNTPQDKIRLLRRFVHENVHAVSGEYNRLDTVAIEKLTSGIGWCDQESRVYMQLAKKQGINFQNLIK